jgi:hypothetical protein
MEIVLIVSRILLVVAGVGVAVHYHLMANFMQRSPHWVKAIALPLATAGGVGMIFCGAYEALLGGVLASGIAMCAVVAINLAAWHNGAHVAVLFEKQAQDKDLAKMRGLMKEYRREVEEIGDILTPSGWQEFEASNQRNKERA